MIAALRGIVADVRGERIVLDVHGVGYEVHASSSVLSGLSKATRSNVRSTDVVGGSASTSGSEVSLVVHTEVRETSITLYGFSSPLEREVFLLLQKVKGIGAKIGLAVVSSLGAESLLVAIGLGDAKRLQGVPGIGKKTAERIILELRESVADYIPATEAAVMGRDLESSTELPAGLARQIEVINESTKRTSGIAQSAQDAMLALERLGFSADRAQRAVTAALAEVATSPTFQQLSAGEVLKRSLSLLG